MSSVLDHLILKPQFQCRTRDVSVQGMKVVLDRPLPEGADVKLWITLPDAGESELKLRGRVCWAKTPSVTGEWLAGIRLDHSSTQPDGIWAKTIRSRIREHYHQAIRGVVS